MVGLPLKISIPCNDEFHEVILSRRGRISFPAHKGRKELQRLLNFEELGGKVKGGCHKVWLAWLNNDGLPGALQDYRAAHDAQLAADRILKTWLSDGRQKSWGGTPLEHLDPKDMPGDRYKYQAWCMVTIAEELRRRGLFVSEVSQWQARTPQMHSQFLVNRGTQAIPVSASYEPADSVSLTVRVNRLENINVVKGKNDVKALLKVADVVCRSLVLHTIANKFDLARQSEDERREALLKKASDINAKFKDGMRFFRVSPTTSLDGLAIGGAIPGPLTEDAAKLALQWLDRMSDKIQKLRTYSAMRLRQAKQQEMENERRRRRG